MIYIIDELILFSINPFGTFVVMASFLCAEIIIIKSIKDDLLRNNTTRLKIKRVFSVVKNVIANGHI